MDTLSAIADVFLHTGAYLDSMLVEYGVVIYAILFGIIFVETGLIVMPFLPGDSLIFAAAALAGAGSLNIWILVALFLTAAIAGDALNYFVGKFFGAKLMEKYPHLISEKHMTRASMFFETYGGKAVILARFVPILRTIVPFMAGAGGMRYPLFTKYNVVGAVLWVGTASAAGFFLGSIPFVQRNFSIILVAIVIISLIPPFFEIIRVGRKHAAVDREPLP